MRNNPTVLHVDEALLDVFVPSLGQPPRHKVRVEIDPTTRTVTAWTIKAVARPEADEA